MTNETKIQHLGRVGLGYLVAGIGYLIFGFPFWFLNAVDIPPKGRTIFSFMFLVDKSFPYDFDFWLPFFSILGLIVANISLWKSEEPMLQNGSRKWFCVPIIGSIFYFLGIWIIFPFTPLGAFLIAVGMIILGIITVKSKVWHGWRQFIILMVVCYPFVFMYPIVILTGARPPAMIGLWGFLWIAMGIAVWQRSKELNFKFQTK